MVKRTFIPKFKVDDLVVITDDYSNNPAYCALFIGKIESIIIKRGKGMFVGEDSRGVYYNIHGYDSCHIPENRIQKYTYNK